MNSNKQISALIVALALSTAATVHGQTTTTTDTSQQLSILTPPSVSVCTPVSIQWSNAAAGNVYISVHKSSDPYGPSIKDFTPMDGSAKSFTWTVDIPADQNVVLRITDSSGLSNSSGFIPVRTGTSTSCLTSGANNTTPAAPTNNTGNPNAGSTTGTGTSTNLPVPQKNSTLSANANTTSSVSPSSGSAGIINSTSSTSSAGTSSNHSAKANAGTRLDFFTTTIDSHQSSLSAALLTLGFAFVGFALCV